MDKKLQDLVWSILPKWFKEEVKKVARIYSGRTSALFGAERHLANKFLDEFIGLFGRHNLTSDAEGEEMLTCNRDVVRMLYDRADSVKVRQTLESLFGSKCLPDNVDSLDSNVDSLEPKPAEPKFKVGDKVRISCAFSSGEIWDSVLNGRVATIVGCYRESNNWIYCFKEPIRDFAEFWLEPCTEQGTLHCPSSETECYIPVRVPKMDEQRLNIATHITAAIYANYDVAKCFESIEAIVRKAVETADALIAGCKKG